MHLIDHLRRGQDSVSEQLYWAGNLALIVQVVIITLVFTRHRWAPWIAVPGGFALALGFFGAHWLPRWGPLSDPLWEVESFQWLSYVASMLEIAGALAVAVAGMFVLRDARGGDAVVVHRPHGASVVRGDEQCQ